MGQICYCHLPPGKDVLESKQHREVDQRGRGMGGEREGEKLSLGDVTWPWY